MAYVDWRISGPELATCNCEWGCPCQFNGLPSRGNCRAAVAMRIDKGHFGETDLSGLRWVGMFAWPAAIHEGNGEALAVVDERADQRQREALLTILSGQESEPGAGMFNVFASTLSTFHEPMFRPIAFEADMKTRKGRFSVPEVIDALGEPIRNPISGQEQDVTVLMPGGFEFHQAAFASSTTKATDKIPLEWVHGHAHFAMIDMGPKGPLN